jgi:AraC-like DNA-binding protein
MEKMINTIVWAAIIQGILLGVLYVFSQKYRSFSNRLLGFFLFALVMEALTIFLPFEELGGYSIMGYFTLPEVKMFFPLLFFHFVLEKIGRSEVYWRFLRIHYGLAFLLVGLTLINFSLFVFSSQSFLSFFSAEEIEVVFFIQQGYAFVLTVIAFILSIKETLRYKHVVANEYSDYSMLEISWLWQFIFIILPISLLWGVELIRLMLGGGDDSDIVLATWGLLVIFIYFVSYKAFRYPNLFEGTQQQNAAESVPKVLPKESMTSHEPDYEQICEEIAVHMRSEKYYLQKDLTVHDLAKEISQSPRLISTSINRTLGVNFSEWVNNYRVDHAIEMLRGSDFEHLSVEGVGLEAGFKSRSAMYTAFKKKTGHPPGHFRETILS